MSDQQLESNVDRLIQLLHKANEEHWSSYFQVVSNLLKEGKITKAKKRILGAYGGMGSFNDIALNFISDEEYDEVMRLSKKIYIESRNIGFFSGLFQ